MKRKETYTFYNYQFKHTAVTITNHPEIQSIHVAEALQIHPIMLYRWRQEMREGKIVDNAESARSISELEKAKKKIKALEKENRRLREENVVLNGSNKLHH